MTNEEAKRALDALGMKQVDLARELGQITGKSYSASTVSNWFGGRGVPDACKVFLTLKLNAKTPVIAGEKADQQTKG